MADSKETFLGRIGNSWKSSFRDVVLIVVSILIAFALEAWWQSRRDAALKHDHLEALLAELDNSRSDLKRFLEGVEQSADASKEVLQLMGPTPEGIDNSQLRHSFFNSVNVGIYYPKKATLEAMLSSGELNDLPNGLSDKLQAWLLMAFDLQVDSEHLERNREIDLLQAVKESGYPWLALHHGLGLPESKFPNDTKVMLSSVEVESILAMRAIRATLLAQSTDSAIVHLDEIIMLLKQELGETTN